MSNLKKAVAILLCEKIRRENGCRWYTVSGLTCRLCVWSSRGDPLKMKIRKGSEFNGCGMVNDWYARLSGAGAVKRFENLR